MKNRETLFQMSDKRILIVMAAGSGTRMGSALPKQFLDLGGKPVLRRTIETFLEADPSLKVITVLPKEHIPWWKEYCLTHDFTCPQVLVSGGFTRFHSVRNALDRVPDGAVVAIHDGVRPLLSKEMIVRMFRKMEESGCKALIPVVPSYDTLKVLSKIKDESGEEVLVEAQGETADRSRIFGAQTPQMFVSDIVKEAYSQAYDTTFTDDASVVSRIGIPLSFCEGERYNIKLTSPEDMALARLLVKPC